MIGLIVFGVVAFLWFVRKNCSPYASNADASGYLNSTRLLLQGQFTVDVPKIEGLASQDWNYASQRPLGFLEIGQTGKMAPSYPVGYPLHLLAAVPFVGLDWAAVLVNVVAAAVAGGLLVILARQLGLPWGWALAGGALMWASPVFVYQVLQPMSDVLAATWCLAAVSCALRGNKHSAWDLATGLAVGVAVLVRPSNALILFPIGVLFGRQWRRWVALAMGGLPAGLFLAWYNTRVYGAIVASGYGDMSWAFQWNYVPKNILHFALGIPLLVSPFVALPALGILRFQRFGGRRAVALIVWTAAFVVFYLFYFFSSPEWWSIRFLLPAFPAIIISGLLVVRQLVPEVAVSGRRTAVLAGLLCLAVAWDVVVADRLHSVIMKRGEIGYVRLMDWMKTNVAPEAIVLTRQASGAFVYYTPFTIVRFDIVSPPELEKLYAAAARSQRPLYAAFFIPEKTVEGLRWMDLRWNRVETVGPFEVWRRE